MLENLLLRCRLVVATVLCMRQVIFGVDMDDVLVDLLPTLRRFASERFGRHLPVPSGWDLTEAWGLTDSQVADMFDSFAASGGYGKLPPMRDGPETVRYLSEAGFQIVVVTARSAPTRSHRAVVERDTVNWLHRFGVPYSGLCFVRQKFRVRTDVSIDDSPEHIQMLGKAGAHTIVFDHAWNRDVSGDLRVKSWGEVPDGLRAAGFLS